MSSGTVERLIILLFQSRIGNVSSIDRVGSVSLGSVFDIHSLVVAPVTFLAASS